MPTFIDDLIQPQGVRMPDVQTPLHTCSCYGRIRAPKVNPARLVLIHRMRRLCSAEHCCIISSQIPREVHAHWGPLQSPDLPSAETNHAISRLPTIPSAVCTPSSGLKAAACSSPIAAAATER